MMTKQRTLTVNGQKKKYDDDMTVAELKRDAGIPANKPMVYNDGTATWELIDTDRVKNISEGATVAPVPDDGQLNGCTRHEHSF